MDSMDNSDSSDSSASTIRDRGLSEEERYQFDRTGYVVLEDVLSESEVGVLNELIDDRELPEPTREPGSGRRFNDFLAWGQPFCELLDHDRVLFALRDILGEDSFRLDHYYGIYMEAGCETLGLHGGGTPHDPAQYYVHHDGSMYNGLTVVAWNLADTGPEDGGFCCIPGSHRSNYECPASVREGVSAADTPGELPDIVEVPSVAAGSVLIFTEALTHGTAPWVGEHQRRSLLYKYSPGHMSWGNQYPEPPEGIEFTERQERLFEPPHVYKRTSLFETDE